MKLARTMRTSCCRASLAVVVLAVWLPASAVGVPGTPDSFFGPGGMRFDQRLLAEFWGGVHEPGPAAAAGRWQVGERL